MKRGNGIRLLAVLVILAAEYLLVRNFALVESRHPQSEAMRRAAELSRRSVEVIDSCKAELGLPLEQGLHGSSLLGDEYTLMTTTLGTREAKIASAHPGYAALLVRWLDEAGVQAGDRVGVTASGSFPGLTIATLAACDALGAEACLIPSLGASSYGANQPLATWADMEHWLRNKGVLRFTTLWMTRGGADDMAAGLLPEGREMIEEAALRNGLQLQGYQSLEEAIDARKSAFDSLKVKAVVNVGGAAGAVGVCPHTSLLPTGLWTKVYPCDCPTRGILGDLYREGVPVVHLLHVRELAAMNGFDPSPGRELTIESPLYQKTETKRSWVALALLLALVPLYTLRKR